MRKSFSIIFIILTFITILLLFLNSTIGFSLITKNFTSNNNILINPTLAQQMLSTKGNNNSVDFHVSGGDDKYGGMVIRGVLTDVIDNEIPIRTHDKKEIANSILTFKVAYLDLTHKLRTIYLAKIIKLTDGSIFSLDVVPVRVSNMTKYKIYYQKNIGTLVFGNFNTNTDKVLDSMTNNKKTLNEINDADKVFNVINQYEQSWQKENTQFIKSGDPGDMQFLLPLLYWGVSFNPSIGKFSVNENN